MEARPALAVLGEEAVDLPFGQERGIGGPGPPPLRERGRAAEPAGEGRALLQRLLAAVAAAGHGEPRFPQGVRERAEAVPVEGLRGHPGAALVEVPPGRGPAELVAEPAELVQKLCPRREAARQQAGPALRRVPGAEALDERLWMHRRLGVAGEVAHGRRVPEALGAGGELGQEPGVGVAWHGNLPG
jgi:hypothetical protein